MHQQESILKVIDEYDAHIPTEQEVGRKNGGWWIGVHSSKKGKNIYRKDLLEMVEMCKKYKRIRYIFVSVPDRFMRSLPEAMYYEVELAKLGVEIKFTDAPELNYKKDATEQEKNYIELMRTMQFFFAQSSNTERYNKAVLGQTAAIRDGRYPFMPKFGYMKGTEPGVHVPIPELKPYLKSILIRLGDGLISLHKSMDEYNNTPYVKSGKQKGYTFDRWKKVVSDPYYAGIVEKNGKSIKARCEHGRHEALITKEQHLYIVDLVSHKSKHCEGPKRKNGNPDFLLNIITRHKECHEEEEKAGRIGKSDRSKLVGYASTNGVSTKKYSRYKCRRSKCKFSITKDELHEKVESILNSLEFTEEHSAEVEKTLKRIWSIEEAGDEAEVKSLRSKIAIAEKDLNKMVDKWTNSENMSSIVEQKLQERIEAKSKEIEDYKAQIAEISTHEGARLQEFIDFAMHFVNHLGTHFFRLTPEYAKKCKLLVFPSGIFVDDNKKVQIPEISWFYRGQNIKKEPLDSDLSSMVEHRRFELLTSSMPWKRSTK